MTPDELAATILNTLPPAQRSQWQHEVGSTTAFVELIFRASLPMFLDIRAVSGAFNTAVTGVSWQNEVGDEPDAPRVVIQGGINGNHVQATFVLNGTGG